MEYSKFWEAVDSVVLNCSDSEEVLDGLAQMLNKLKPEEIIEFKQKQYELDKLAYRWDIWAVAYILNGGCSDDGFEYFRAGLISGGRKKFEDALSNPETIADWLPGDFEGEDFMYLANDAYANLTGNEFPYDQLVVGEVSEPAGQEWDEDDLPTLYPDLCKRYF